MDLKALIPADWQQVLADEFAKPYFAKLGSFVENEYRSHTVYPPSDRIFAAFDHTPYDSIKVLLLGQDPYHGPKQANGLCFSVYPGITPPPSLKNMFKEMQADLGTTIPNNGDLTPWADQGVLLLNAVLTVRQKEPASHKNQGWETFTDAIIKKVSERPDPVVFLLWGGFAKKKTKLIDAKRHTIIEGTHPSPLSADNGFFGSRPYSTVNNALETLGKPPIDWTLPNV